MSDLPPTLGDLERGKTWVFAAAIDWPGWCRRGKGDEAALETLLTYADRYAAVAGPGFEPGELKVVGSSQGSATTDFGAPDARAPWDDEPLSVSEADRLTCVLEACWHVFDHVVAGAPAQLRRGPRGGGRDRDAIVDHVREAERSYGRKVGPRVPPRTPWEEQRRILASANARRRAGWLTAGPLRCPPLDHAWEIEDKSE